MNNIVLLIAFFGLIYFMMIRPQQKQQKKRREMLNNLSKGDKIFTVGGIGGTIKSIKDDKLVLEIAKGVNVNILKTAVGHVVDENEDQVELLSEAESSEDN